MNVRYRTTIAVTILLALVALGALEARERESGRGGEDKAHLVLPVDQSVTVERLPRAGGSGFDVERLWSHYNDWEPTVAADPGSPYVYQLTTRIGGPNACPSCNDAKIIFRASANRGATWGPDQFVLATRQWQFDPQIRVASDGTIDVAFLVNFSPGVTFLHSTDRGQTWSMPISFSGPGANPAWSDRPALGSSPNGRHVYLAFNHSDSWVVYSHDYGRHFSAPLQITHDRRYWFHSAIVVTPRGDVVIAAEDYSQNYKGPAHIDILRSSDGGRTWSTTRIDTGHEPPTCSGVPGCYFGFLGPTAGLGVDARGSLLLAYNVNGADGNPQGLYVRTSRDGLTWSPRTRLSPNGANAGFPSVVAGHSPGDFRVTWMDTRSEHWNTWYERIVNGVGRRQVRLSDARSGARYKHDGGYDFPYGDYFGLSVDQLDGTQILWGEGPSWTGPGGTWYTRETQ